MTIVIINKKYVPSKEGKLKLETDFFPERISQMIVQEIIYGDKQPTKHLKVASNLNTLIITIPGKDSQKNNNLRTVYKSSNSLRVVL